MEIVIKLPDDEVIEIMTIMQAIKRGHPLPPKHGRLIDADEVQEIIAILTNQTDGIYQLPQQIDNLRTIIEATEVKG